MTTLYLSGPMSGFEAFNFPAFARARAELRSAGFVVLCPAEADEIFGFDPTVDDWTDELAEKAHRRDVQMILEADAVAVLPGFTGSTGATAEIRLARWLGLAVVSAGLNAFGTVDVLTSAVDAWLEDRDDETANEDGLPVSERRGLLLEAAELVDGDRNAQYGDPQQDFERTAAMWGAYLGAEIAPHDVAALMALLKVSRIRWSPEKRDSWADLAGYAACGWDVADRRSSSD